MRHPSRTNQTNRIGRTSMTSRIITTGTMIKTVITTTGMMMIGAVRIVTITPWRPTTTGTARHGSSWNNN